MTGCKIQSKKRWLTWFILWHAQARTQGGVIGDIRRFILKGFFLSTNLNYIFKIFLILGSQSEKVHPYSFKICQILNHMIGVFFSEDKQMVWESILYLTVIVTPPFYEVCVWA